MIVQAAFVRSLNPRACWRWIERVQARGAPEARHAYSVVESGNSPVIEWVRGVRERGIESPIRVGLAGPASVLTLIRYAVRCGIGNSLHVLTENPSFAKVLGERGPEPIIRRLAASIGDGDGRLHGIAGLHFYIFGGFRKTLDWIAAERSMKVLSPHT